MVVRRVVGWKCTRPQDLCWGMQDSSWHFGFTCCTDSLFIHFVNHIVFGTFVINALSLGVEFKILMHNVVRWESFTK